MADQFGFVGVAAVLPLVAPNNNLDEPPHAAAFKVPSDAALVPPYARKGPLPLAILCQIEVLKPIHRAAAAMEEDYLHRWLDKQLVNANRQIEMATNIVALEVDTEEVVLKYKSREEDMMNTRRKEYVLRGEKLRARMEKALKADSALKARKRTMSTRTTKSRQAPYLKQSSSASLQAFTLSEEQIIKSLKPKMTRGIPEGAEVNGYIMFRKCKYIEDIKAVRAVLAENLSPPVLNDLMSTMYNIAQFNDKHEHGLLTLQAMLMNPYIQDFRIASAKLYKNFSAGNPYGHALFHVTAQQREMWVTLETRMATTILHFMLTESARLTHLNLERCACDSLLKVLSAKAPNLKYLNINGSVVSDQGLLYLCGVEKDLARKRPRLSRSCKEEDKKKKLVTNEAPRWSVKGAGCSKITRLLAKNLIRVDWTGVSKEQVHRKYYDHATVPVDSGFVAVLVYMKDLRVLVSEVGARSVYALAKLKQKKLTLNLESVGDSMLTSAVLKSVIDHCPKLTSLKVEWIGPGLQPKEEWIDRLGECTGLKSLLTCDISFSSERLPTALPSMGASLTSLDLRDVGKLKYSQLRLFKIHCQNLESFSLAVTMTVKHVMMAVTQIQIDKDYNLELNSNEKYEWRRLKEFHLSGPFGYEVVRYLLTGAVDVRALTLGIEWLGPAFCDSQPSGRKDLVGREYLEEILSVNPLCQLEELHLIAQYRRGRTNLTRECAEFVLDRFPRLRHLGNFSCWNMTRLDQHCVRLMCKGANRAITFDEELHTRHSEKAVFEYNYIPGRHRLSCCCQQSMSGKEKTMSNSLFTDFFDVLAGGPMMIGDEEDDDEDLDFDDEDEDMDLDMVDAISSDDEDDDGDDLPDMDAVLAGQVEDFANPCAIM